VLGVLPAPWLPLGAVFPIALALEGAEVGWSAGAITGVAVAGLGGARVQTDAGAIGRAREAPALPAAANLLTALAGLALVACRRAQCAVTRVSEESSHRCFFALRNKGSDTRNTGIFCFWD
jgi:hypothetical protein